jgi:hypothetical protein
MAASAVASPVPMAQPRGWNKPVKPLALIVVSGLVLMLWLVLMTASVWYFYEHWEAKLTLHNQAVSLRLPAGMQAMAEVAAPMHSRIDMQPLLHVPIKQVLTAQLPDHVQANVKLQTTLPIDTTVKVDQVVPISTVLNMSVSLKSWLPRIPVTLPVTLNLPLHMVVPVKADVPVDLDVVASGDLPPTLNIPIDATFDVRPHVKGNIQARMVSQTAFSLLAPVEPFPLSIEEAHLRVPFNLTFLKQRVR